MFLCWVESTMRDFVVLNNGTKDMRDRYSKAFGKGNHPSDFARERLNLGTSTFATIKDIFLSIWPKWKTQNDVYEAIERAVIWRNAFAHAQIQVFRPFLLYTPNEHSWKKIERFTRCHKCLKYHKDCQCPTEGLTNPNTITIRCLDDVFLRNLYSDIGTIDLQCFRDTAQTLSVPYNGIAWPRGDTYVISSYRPDEQT